ncbi:MAG: DUF445 family protein [Cyanobacteria bacterium P01_A01_bin.123]
MTLAWSQIGLLIVSPIVGGIIGYFTNDIAIKMLFRPYEAKQLGKWQLPFTPGLIPRNQGRLAQRIADTIMGSLLTPEELQNLARRLLATERIQGAIDWLLKMALDQVKAETQERTTKILANVMRDVFSQAFPRLLKVWSRQQDFLEAQLNQIFDQVLLDFQLTDAQAQQLSSWILNGVLPPDMVRQGIVDFLTDRNIRVIDETFREKTSGTYWVVANLFGVRNSLVRLRTFCLDEREASNARIAELTMALDLRSRLKEVLQNFSLQNLPVSTVRQLRRTLRETVQDYLQVRGTDAIEGLGNSIDWEELAAQLLSRLQTSVVVSESLGMVSEELALILERYLEQDLENIVAQAIPILNIDQVIYDRVMATSARDLEMNIQGIVRSELQAIVNLGGILGFTIGCLQGLFLFLQSH